jgi:hypothetical membrane protein
VSLILGMGVWVFTAWILTIISAIFCVLYGVYHEFIKKHLKKSKKTIVKETK